MKPIDYRYLNVDEKKFYDSQRDLIESFNEQPYYMVCLQSWEHNQVLFAGSHKHLDETTARMTCQRLTGVIK